MRGAFPILLAFLSLGALTSAPVAVAAVDINSVNAEYVADVESDYHTVSTFVNGQMARSFGFYSSLGWQVNPTVLDVIKGPRVGVGIGAGVDLLKVSDVNSLQLQVLESGGNIEIPKVLPLPFPVWHVKGGLLKGVDFGIRGGSIPRLKINEGRINFANKSLGMELRCRAIAGKTLPTVTVSATWDRMEGDIYVANDVSQRAEYWDDGTLTWYTGTIEGQTVYHTDWNVRSFGMKVVVGKGFGMAYPFAGVGFQRNAGTVRSSLSVRVHESLTDGVTTAEQDMALEYASGLRPKVVEPKILLGIDLGSVFYWNFLGETNAKDYAVSTGFRIQF